MSAPASPEEFAPLHRAAVAADDAYHAELVATFGRQACNARYDTRRNGSTETLARLRAVKLAADEALHRAWGHD